MDGLESFVSFVKRCFSVTFVGFGIVVEVCYLLFDDKSSLILTQKDSLVPTNIID